MHVAWRVMLAGGLLAASLAGAPGGASTLAGEPDQARAAVERSLAFLQADAARWRNEHSCATCHHGNMTVWALHEAQKRVIAKAPAQDWAHRPVEVSSPPTFRWS